MKVFVVGNIAVDETFVIATLPRAGESILATAAGRDLGGKGANQAMVMARAGLDVVFVSATGNDDRGEWIRAALAEEAIETGHVARITGPSDLSIILTDSGGENTIVTTTEAARAIPPDRVTDALDSSRRGDWLALQGNLEPSLTRAILEQARLRGVTTAFNPSPHKREFPELIGFADVLVVNRTEALELTGSTEPEAAAARLRALGARAVAITLGAEGAVYATSGGITHIRARRQEAVDTTGAGDTFMAAAIASAALRGLNTLDPVALDAGAAAAAVTVSRIGTRRAFPTRDELRAILA
jgi:ribokinase